MIDLSTHGVLRGQLIEGQYFAKFADHISTYLAETLFHTSDIFLKPREKKELVRDFINIDLCQITEDFVFTHPFEQNETNVYNIELKDFEIKSIQEDCELKIAVAEMKRKFIEQVEILRSTGVNVRYNFYENNDEIYTIGSYRRDLNYNN